MSLIGKFFGGKGGKGEEENRPANAAKPAGNSASSTRRPASSSSVRLPRPGASASSVKLPAIRPTAESAKPDESKRKIRASTKGKEIGAILIKDSRITEEQLEKALEIQRKKGGLLGQILVSLGFCTKADIGAALRKQRTITTIVLDKVKFDPEALQALPRPFCEKNRLIPFEKIGNQLCVAMANVLDAQAKNDMKQMTQLQIKSFDAIWIEIKAAIEREMAGQESAPAEATAPAPMAKKEAAEDIVIELPEDELLPTETAAAAQPPAAPAPPATSPERTKDTAVIAKPPAAPAAAGKAASPAIKPPPAPTRPAAKAPAAPSAVAPSAPVVKPALPPTKPQAASPPAAAKPALAPQPAVVATKPTAAPPSPPKPQIAVKPEAAAKPAAIPPPPPEKIAAVAAATAAAAIEVIEDLAAYGIEEIAPPAAALQEIPEIAAEVSFPVEVLSAIPMTDTYFAEVVQWGKADPERRWLAEHLADNVLPVEPAPDKIGA